MNYHLIPVFFKSNTKADKFSIVDNHHKFNLLKIGLKKTFFILTIELLNGWQDEKTSLKISCASCQCQFW